MQGILEYTAAFGSHGCFCCKQNFSHINKMVSAVSPHPPSLTFSSPHPSPLSTQPENREGRKEEDAEPPDTMRKHAAP